MDHRKVPVPATHSQKHWELFSIKQVWSSSSNTWKIACNTSISLRISFRRWRSAGIIAAVGTIGLANQIHLQEVGNSSQLFSSERGAYNCEEPDHTARYLLE